MINYNRLAGKLKEDLAAFQNKRMNGYSQIAIPLFGQLSMESNKSLVYNTLRTARISGSSVSGFLPIVFWTLLMLRP